MGIASGQVGKFAELKKYGKKLASFKQMQHLEVVQDSVSPEEFGQVSVGCCVALCFTWLALKLVPSDDFFAPSFSPKRDEWGVEQNHWSAANAALALDAIRGQIRYQSLRAGEGNHDHVIRQIAEEKGLLTEGGARPFEYQTPAAMMVQLGTGSLGPGDAALILETDGILGHAIAAWKKTHGVFRFFDPNVGDYEVNQMQMRNFFDSYVRLRGFGHFNRHAWFKFRSP